MSPIIGISVILRTNHDPHELFKVTIHSWPTKYIDYILDPKIVLGCFVKVPNNLFIFIYYITPTPVYFKTFSGFVSAYPVLSIRSLLIILLLMIIVNL